MLLTLIASATLAPIQATPALPVPATAQTSTAASSGSSGPHAVGGVYAMSNDFISNRIVAYSRNDDGTLELIGDFPTGGRGAAFDGGEGLDPLISAYAVLMTDNNDFLLATNAGSNTITAFRVNEDFSLTRTDVVPSGGVGPNSIAYRNGFVAVTNIDADGVFNGEPDQEGSFMTYRLTPEGKLIEVPLSRRVLRNRPSAIQFDPDGSHVVIASINAGSAALASGSNDEIVAYRIDDFGRPGRFATGAAASTQLFNAENRNLASAIGFEIVEQNGRDFVVVTEAREFQADGSPPAFPALQTGSVSTWELNSNGTFSPILLDVLAGDDLFDGQRTACWLEFSLDQKTFWVSNALEASISTYSFNEGWIGLIEEVSASGNGPDPSDPFGTSDGWIDMWISDDGEYLYQLYGLSGTVGVFKVVGSNLTLIQEVQDLPLVNTQGIVAF